MALMGDDTTPMLLDPGLQMAYQAIDNLGRLRMGQQTVNPMQAYQQAIAQRAAMRQRDRAAELQDLQMQKIQRQLDTPAAPQTQVLDGTLYERQGGQWTPVIQSAEAPQTQVVDGVLYERQDGEWVAQTERAPEDRETAKDAAGFLRFTDTGERVFPEVMAPEQEPEFADYSKLRKEFRDETAVFKDQQASFGRVVESARDPSAAGDLALIFNYMKILDPGSTVREGEFATAQNAAGVPSRIRARFNNLMKGERLEPEQRADFVDRAARLYRDAAEDFESTAGEYRALAESEGFDPDKVILRSVRFPAESYADLVGEDLGAIPD